MRKKSPPPPERKIHGSSPGATIVMRNPDPANWDKWTLIPNSELWQAVCLSMDFEPPKRCDVVEFLHLDQKTFKDRMQVCMANLGGELPAADMHLQIFSTKAARVNLATFAAVVSKWSWSIPQRLQALARHATTPTPETTTTVIRAPVVEAVRHTTKGERRNILKPVIEHAQTLCKDPWDTADVWGQLHTLTAQKYTVLLHLEDNAVVYMDGDNTKKLTRKQLGERLATARKKLGSTV